MTKKCDVVIDLQFGSTGKGLICGYLAFQRGYDTVVTANMPNAGHTYIDQSYNKYMHKVLPLGVLNPACRRAMIGPGAVFDVSRLFVEVQDLPERVKENVSLYIHEDAVVLRPHHTDTEKRELSKIASTAQGSAAAATEKMMRDESRNNRAANYFHFNDRIFGMKVELVTQAEWLKILYLADSILLEGAQGYSLGLNAGFWPYCTSRDCTPSRFMADCQIPLGMLRRVIGTARVHPIRVGNTDKGNSGPCYPDQREMSWAELAVPKERTTVTNRVRRVFSFSNTQIMEAIMACQPNEVFLNFCNYDPEEAVSVTNTINGYLQQFVPGGGSVRYTGWGPGHNDVRETHPLNPCDYTEEEHKSGYAL